MKKEVVLVLALVMFSFSFVVAATCEDNQTIMRLYSPHNSHVSAWNESVDTYLTEICYDDIFGEEYVGDNPHNCTGNNRIVSLSSDSNAHASITTSEDYPYEVCYGNLKCVYDNTTGDDCGNGGEVVARLFYESNTHVSDASDSNYPIKVCCGGSGVYWADMNGNPIDVANIGDTIELVANGVGSGSFNVVEKDCFLGICLHDDIINISGEKVGNGLVGTWTIGEKELSVTKGDLEDFRFSINGEESGGLEILDSEEDSPMVLKISNPVCGSYYNESEVIPIVVDASDEDDVIDGHLRVGGEDKAFSNGGITYNKTLDASGSIQIVVDASTDRGDKARAVSNIMVLGKEGSNYVDGTYVAACIDKPENYMNIPSGEVECDASSTRGARVVGGVLDILIPGEDRFTWNWTFSPQGISKNMINTTDPFGYKFNASFSMPGKSSASLKVEV